MLYGTAAFDETGMPRMHADAIQDVADRTGHAILFRAVGSQSTHLLEEGYEAKGFRIDTKSCDWGPMRGFVCVDPRLSKVGGNAAKVADNRGYTTEALEGRIRHDAIGGLDVEGLGGEHAVMPEWMAGCKPVVISWRRYLELTRNGLRGAVETSGIIRGVSTDTTGTVRFPWVLIPIARCIQSAAFSMACGPPPPNGFGVFVDYSNAGVPFVQQTPGGATPIRVLGYDAVLGLINPGTEAYGYRACVTGDYDLFGVWPPVRRLDPFAARTGWDERIVDRYRSTHPGTAVAHHFQHHKLGNITGRLLMVKVLLNTALIGSSEYPGGNLIHHSDEIGNPSPGLRKSLAESLPILAFLPRDSWAATRVTQVGLCITSLPDFTAFVGMCRRTAIQPELRPEWAALAP